MFKKKDPIKSEKTTREVVTERVERTGGMQTTTTTITCTKDDFDAAFERLNMDPVKFRSGGTSVTKQIVYTDSAGRREVIEETVETYGDAKELPKAAKPALVKGDITKTVPETSSKTFVQKLGFGSQKKAPVEEKPSSSQTAVLSKPVKGGRFEEDCLKKHNEYRAKHGVPKLTLSKEVCSYAKEWADKLAATDSFKHRTERKYGENIFMKWSSDPNHVVSGDEAVDSWYSEIKDHTFGQEPRSLKSGHFTQVIWKESKSLGVAWARSKSGKILVVANYDPPGNFIGKFAENVPPPKK